MAIPEHLMAIEYTVCLGFPSSSYQEDRVALFNSTIISEAEVRKCIEQDFLFETNSKIVVITKKQYDNLFDKIDSDREATKLFYADLAMEQKETM